MDRWIPRLLMLLGYVGVAWIVFWPFGHEMAALAWLVFGLGAFGLGQAAGRGHL